METKRCKNCKQIKNKKEFYKDNRVTSLVFFRNYCITCWKEKCRNYNQLNHEKNLIRTWYSSGIRYPNFSKLYNIYIKATNCYFCDITFDNKIKKRDV